MNYSKNIVEMEASAVREVMVKAAKLDDVISLSVGQPDFKPQDYVVEAAKKMMDQSSAYAPGAGVEELREVYVEYLNEQIGTDYKTENVMVTAGGMSAVYLSLLCCCDPGDEVLICEPYYTNYAGMVQMQYAKPVKVSPKAGSLMVDADDIEKVITEKTKMLMLNSPSNPTGQVMPAETLEKIAVLAKKHNFFVMTDEVYRHIIFDNKKFCSIASIKGLEDRMIVVDSCSKSNAMPGYRVGFLTGPVELIDLCVKSVENVYSCVTTVVQYAAIAAIREGAAYRKEMCEEYERRRDFLCERIDRIPKLSYIRPEGAFYLFMNVSETGMTGQEFADRLLEEKHVAVVPGATFGVNAEYYVRISFGTGMEQLKTAFDRIDEFLMG